MGCMYCNRDDQFVEDEGKCILHCDKTKWVVKLDGKHQWIASYVNAFWKVVRNEVMSRLDEYTFSYVVFPAFEKQYMEVSSSSHIRHKMHVAKRDFSFWKKGDEIAFDKKTDFSHVQFIEPITFKNVFFKEVEFTKISASSISFYETTLQSLNIKESVIKQMHFKNSNLEKVFLDRCQNEILMFRENFIDKLFITKSSIDAAYIQKIKEGRNLMINDSKIDHLEVKELTNSRLSISATHCKLAHIENIITDNLNFKNSVFEYFISLNNKITSFEVNACQLNGAFHVGSGQISKLSLQGCTFSENTCLWLSDITVKELSIKESKNEITLCSLEKVKLEKEFSVHNTIIKNMYVERADFSSPKLILSFIKMEITQSQSKTVNWGILKPERLDCDEGSLTNLYKIYEQKGDKEQAGIFHYALCKTPMLEEDKKEPSSLLDLNKVSSLLSRGKEVIENISMQEIKKEVLNLKNKIPKLRLEIKETKKDMFEVQITKLEDPNAPILVYPESLSKGIKSILSSSCDLIGCARLQQFVSVAK